MAYKKDIKPFLKESNLTWEEMDNIWKDCCEVNKTCKLISDSGKNWSDLHISQIKKLPTLVEETLRQKEENDKKDEELKLQKEEERKQREYYENHFESIMINKISSGEKLTEIELERLVSEYEYDCTPHSKHRWTQTMETVCKLNDRFFSVVWEQALTENQCNSFMEQPVEVFPREVLKIIKTTQYFTDKSVEGCKEESFGVDFLHDNINNAMIKIRGAIFNNPLYKNGFKIILNDKSIAIVPADK